MKEERVVEIKVFGQTFSVKTDAEEDHLQAVAQYVNEKMEEILKKTRSVSTLNVAILTALNIADDLLKEKEQRKALVKEVEVKSKDLVDKINVRMVGKEAKKITFVDERCSPAERRMAQGIYHETT